MEHFPAFMKLCGRKALVIGGGAVAARKVELLRRAGARIAIVAPELTALLADGIAAGDYCHQGRRFAAEHLDGAVLVVAATDDHEVNASVARHARLRGIPVNVVDDAELSSFIMPAIVDRAPVTVAISTGGASPVLARWVRTRIETALPSALGRVAALAGRMRREVKARIPDIGRRRRFWEQFLDGPAAGLALDGRDEAATELVRRALGAPAPAEIGQVWLVGAGPGDPDLLTIKALRALQSAEVIVHDRLVSDGVLDLARRDAERIYVGKQPGRHAMTQPDINQLLISLARDGRRVVRLKGGDPFMFGRGGEEMAALAEAGIVCHVVPGITAAAGCAAQTGIPLTHRDMAQSCMFATGHGRHGLPDLDWAAAARPGQTLVIYMGLGNLAAIARRLIDHGLAPSIPAAVIANGTTPDARAIIAPLHGIARRADAAAVTSPALVIIGDVVGLARPALENDLPPEFTATEKVA
jgi:uroporphyrin-III C-methyltransferase / precorrin-2 dehydrogenase / sirohydrochlorin ferrochelatase